eukprot:SAG31_NODE_15_length_37942_cov_32.078297_5_plen_120_part_00
MYQVYYKDRPWGDSFYVGGFVSVFGGVMVLLFLIEHPHNVWIRNPDEETKSAPSNAQALEAKLVEPDQEDIGPVRLLWALSLPVRCLWRPLQHDFLISAASALTMEGVFLVARHRCRAC